MAKKLTLEESKIYRKYHYPHTGNLNSVKVGAIFINKNIKKGYTKEHELMKFELAWEASGLGQKYIIEAERKATPNEIRIFKLVSGKKIIDFVNLTQKQEIEIVHKHETHQQIKFYRKNFIVALIVGKKFQCKGCQQYYPTRLKRHKDKICDVCFKS